MLNVLPDRDERSPTLRVTIPSSIGTEGDVRAGNEHQVRPVHDSRTHVIQPDTDVIAASVYAEHWLEQPSTAFD